MPVRIHKQPKAYRAAMGGFTIDGPYRRRHPAFERFAAMADRFLRLLGG